MSCREADHAMHSADKKFEAEINEKRKQIDDSSKIGMENMNASNELGVLMSIKKTVVDPKIPAKRAYMILLDNAEKCSKTADKDGRVYFWIRRDGESYDTYSHDSVQLARFVTREYVRLYGDPISSQAVAQAIGSHTAKGDVPSNIMRHTGRRIIKVKDTVWIDLQDDENSIYRITPDRCGPTVPYSPKLGILFDRGGGSEMPMPQRKEGDWLNWFANMLRIPKEKQMLFKVHVCHMVCVWQETPFMMITGPEGTGKTFTATLIKELVDPVGMKSTNNILPKDENKLAMMLTQEQMTLFDNISYISKPVSDMLCQACTGGIHKLRELYTTNNVMQLPFHKMRILLTGISKTTIYAPDLASRILHYDALPGQTKESKNDLTKEYLENRPYILYAVLKTISLAMKEYNSRRNDYDTIKAKTRMTDFERFGSAIAYVLGDRNGESIDLYREIMQSDMTMMVADDPLLQLVEEVLQGESTGEYYNLTSVFYARIREIAETGGIIDTKGKDFPKNTSSLRRHLDRLKGALLERGIDVKIGKIHGRDAIVRQASHIKLERREQKTD